MVPGRPQRIWVVDDDPELRRMLATYLGEQGFAVRCLEGSAQLLARLEGRLGPERPDLLVLDLMLPGDDGLTLLRRLRDGGDDLPVLMLTARADGVDRIIGLEQGADDYLAKPFDVRELMARVRALLRRESSHRTGRIQIADLEIDTVGLQAYRQGVSLNLTPREFQLLEALARHEGRTLTRTWIMETVWGNEDLYENTVNFHVASLRRKVDQDSLPKLIHTVHGIGYMLKVPA
jgi:two-component system phosphate regulon response regulator OmpR